MSEVTFSDIVNNKYERKRIQEKAARFESNLQSEGTEKALKKAVKHIEKFVGREGTPITAEELATYIYHYAEDLSLNTIEQRRYLISSYHQKNGWENPSNSELVRNAIKGVRASDHRPVKAAKPMPIQGIWRFSDYIDELIADLKSQLAEATADHEKDVAERKEQAEIKRKKNPKMRVRNWTDELQNPSSEMKRIDAKIKGNLRDKAMVLLSFWFGLRGDELLHIRKHHITFYRDHHPRYMDLYIPRSKTDQKGDGRNTTIEEMTLACPMNALEEWILYRDNYVELGAAKENEYFVFSKISAYGTVGEDCLTVANINTVLRKRLSAAGLDANEYSSHSMRRGLANWIVDNDGSIKDLMSFIGWKSEKTAIRYLEGRNSLPNKLIEKNEEKLAINKLIVSVANKLDDIEPNANQLIEKDQSDKG